MSVIDRPPDQAEEGQCPVCGGQGQVWLDGEPRFCLPCEGTGRAQPDG